MTSAAPAPFRAPASFRAHDGTRVAYRTLGDGPPLVCVPGGPGRASEYLEDLGGLARERTLVLLDNRGTGASDVPDDPATYAPERLAEDVDALRQHLGLDRADVLGHSAGGVVAQHWAAGQPDRVGRLVLVTTYLQAARDTASLDADRERVIGSRRHEPWFADVMAARARLADVDDGVRVELEKQLRPLWYGAWSARQQEHAASADRQMAPAAESGFRSARSGLPAEALAGVRTPVLVVAGACDALLPPLASRQVAEVFPDARLVELAGCGHFPWVDDGEAFTAAVGGFLARR